MTTWSKAPPTKAELGLHWWRKDASAEHVPMYDVDIIGDGCIVIFPCGTPVVEKGGEWMRVPSPDEIAALHDRVAEQEQRVYEEAKAKHDALLAQEALLARIAEQAAEIAALNAEAADERSWLASCTDFANTWAREAGVDQAEDVSPRLLRSLVHRLWDKASSDRTRLDAEIAALKAEVARLRTAHAELIMEVASVCPGESRHETARRYIRERENSAADPASHDMTDADLDLLP